MATVKLLLKESIKNVGRVGDVVEVSPGYARNYLLPQDLAVEPTPNNVKKIEERRKEIEKQERERREQQARADRAARGRRGHARAPRQRAGPPVRLRHRDRHRQGAAGPGLQHRGRTTSTCPASSTASSKYTVQVKFADDLATEVKVWVAPDADSKAAMDAARQGAATPRRRGSASNAARRDP